MEFTRRLVRLYFSQPVLQRRRFFHGEKLEGSAIPDILWLDPNGKEMTKEAWDVPFVRCLGVQLYGKHVDVNEHGEPIHGDTLLILFNGDQKIDIPFVLPPFDGSSQWQRLLDTADPKADDSLFPVGQKYPLTIVLGGHFASDQPRIAGDAGAASRSAAGHADDRQTHRRHGHRRSETRAAKRAAAKRHVSVNHPSCIAAKRTSPCRCRIVAVW